MPNIKDANDLLQAWLAEGMDENAQARALRKKLDEAEPIVLTAARWAGGLEGAQRDAAVEHVFGMIGGMPDFQQKNYRTK